MVSLDKMADIVVTAMRTSYLWVRGVIK